ncbi:MAG: hypothetical protein ACE5PV_13145 [Candidatus Poribacteria bacterium]
MPIEEQNYPILLFSKGRKRKQFLKDLARKATLPETRKVAVEYLRLAYQLYPQDVMEVFSMSKDFPTLEENIQVIIKDLGAERILAAMQPQEIAQAIPVKQKEILLRVLIEQLGAEKVEAISRNDGKRKT